MINLKTLIALIEYNSLPDFEELTQVLMEQCEKEKVVYTKSKTHYIFPVGDGVIHVPHEKFTLKIQLTDVSPDELASKFKDIVFVTNQGIVLVASHDGKILIPNSLIKELKQYLNLED